MSSDDALKALLQEKLLHLMDTQPNITPDFLECISIPPPEQSEEEAAARLQVLKAKALPFKVEVPPDPAAPPPEGGEPEKEDLLPLEVEGDIGDMLQDLLLLERAGVGFGREENMRLFLAVKTLVHKNPDAAEGEKITRARFWGKIYGTQSDYIIAECSVAERKANPPLPEGDQDPAIVPPDPIGGPEAAHFISSSNEFVYYVCSAPGQPWTRLPDVHPGNIKAARTIRRYLTGDLNSKVSSKCPFPGKEADYLRTQIARIVHECRIAPRGHLADTTDYEGGGDMAVDLSEEGSFLGMTGQELCELHKSAWVHATLDILPQGRCQYHNYGWTPPDDHPEAKDPRLEKNRKPLESVSLDKAPFLNAPAWSAHVCGTKNPQFASAVVRSTVWPGACAVGWGYTFANFYIGWGLNQSGAMFAPAMQWTINPDKDQTEFKRNEKCNGIAGDLNLEPPPPPAEEEPAA